MSTTVADIQAKLTADTAQFSSAFHEAQRLTESFTGKLGGLEGVLAKGFTIAAIAKVGQAIFEATERAGKFAEELEQISTITGVATSTLQDWSVVLNRVGMGVQDVAGMTRILSRNIEEAKDGTQEAIDKFAKLGITITQTSESEQVIRQIADSMSHMGSATERAAAATELLGRGGQRAINFLANGSAAFDEAAEAAARMGKLTEAQIETLSKTDDALDDVGKSWEGLSNQIGAIFAPAVKVAAQALIYILNETQMAVQKVWLRFQDLINGVNSFAQQLLNIGKGVFSGEIFSSSGRDAISQRAKAIIDEEASVRDLIRADHALIGTAEQYKSATEKKTQATQSASSALKEYRRAVELAIEIDKINSEQRVEDMIRKDNPFFTAPTGAVGKYQEFLGQANLLRNLEARDFGLENALAIEKRMKEAHYADSIAMLEREQSMELVIKQEAIAESIRIVERDQKMELAIKDQARSESIAAIQRDQAMELSIKQEAMRKSIELTQRDQEMDLAIKQEAMRKSIELTQRDQEMDLAIKQEANRESWRLQREWEQDNFNQVGETQRQLGLQIVQAETERYKAIHEGMSAVFNSVNQAFDTVVQGVLLGTQTMSQAIKRLGVDIAASLGKEMIAKPITKALGDMITESMASGMLSKAGSFASGLLPSGMSLGMAGGVAAGAAGVGYGLSKVNWNNQTVNTTAGSLMGGMAGGIGASMLIGAGLMSGGFLLPIMGLGMLLGGLGGNMFGGDDGREGRMRNETDFIHGTQQAAKDWMKGLTTANTPARLQEMMMNGDLPGAHGGSHGTILSSFAPGGVINGATIGFRSAGQFRFLGSIMDEAGQEFVRDLQKAVDTIIKAFNDANEKIVSQLVGMAMQTASQATTAQDFLLKRTQINRAIQQQIDSAHADMIGMTDPTQLSAQVNKIQTLLQQRYNGEVQMVQAFVGKIQQSIAAWNGLTASIDDQLSGLRLNRFGAPTPEAQLAFDQSRFSSALTSFRGSRTASAGAMVSDLASPLLTAAAALAGGDMTSSSYQATWQTVVDALEEVRKTSVDETTKLNNDMLAALGEQTTLENLIQQNTKRMADSLDNLRLEASAQFRAMGFNIPQFAEGTDYVPKTGLALVHKGEEIVPVGGRSSRGITVQVSGNTFIGTEQSMLRDLARKIQPYINSNPSMS